MTSINSPVALLDEMSERQLLCLYIIVQWILKEHDQLSGDMVNSFNHLPYLNTLPSVKVLRTPLHFNEPELELLRGTNLYGATLDRRNEWEAEWAQARQCITAFRHDWHDDEFTWERYLTASTYISSRAFPSTLLSPNPSLISSESSYPILLPGVDSLNHLRGHQVSWVVDPCLTPRSSESPPLQVTLVTHQKTPARQEVFNNYGPKPNSEFILGYGFSIANNLDDTIVLKIGGASGSSQRWEIGRDAKGIQGLWEEMQGILRNMEDGDDENEGEMTEAELCLEAADMLENMIQRKIQSLPVLPDEPQTGVRREVFTMIEHYVEGQRDILNSVLRFAQTKQEEALAEEE